MNQIEVPGVAIDTSKLSSDDGDKDENEQPFAPIQVSSQRGPLTGIETLRLPEKHAVEVTLEANNAASPANKDLFLLVVM